MIEITHSQARRLIREALDSRASDGRRMPETQWTALQAHLESCDECRRYEEQLGLLERSARRALRSGWDKPVYRSNADLAPLVLPHRAERDWLRRQITLALLGVVLALFVAYGVPRLRFFKPAVPADSATPAPDITPLPTPVAGEFRGVIAYQSGSGNRSDIYLLNPGDPSGPTNLTGGLSATRNTDPAWSPDGEWLAFLSDRSGRAEVYASNVAGNRVVRLTDSPGVEWEGPLSWSADGKLIALAGTRVDQGHQRWIYLVPLDGSGAYPLARSRGGDQPEFAPARDRQMPRSVGGAERLLAFTFTLDTQSGVAVTDPGSGEVASVTWADNPLVPPGPPGGMLDWAANGNGLLYASTRPASTPDQPDGMALNTVQVYGFSSSLFADQSHSALAAETRWPGGFRSISAIPSGGMVYLEDVSDARARDDPRSSASCWTLHFSPGDPSHTLTFGDLCVEAGLDRASWTPDGRWLVVVARTMDEMIAGAPHGLYAVALPGWDSNNGWQFVDNGEIHAVRLGTVDNAAEMPRVRPQLRFNRRSAGTSLGIDPQPVKTAQILPPASTKGLTGEVVYARPHGSGSVIARMSPDGTGGLLLYASQDLLHCPVWSPDDQWVAFVSTPGNVSQESAIDQVLVMDRWGDGVVQVSRGDVPVRNQIPVPQTFGCPVWSPDGNYLAVKVNAGINAFLAILPADGNGSARYVELGPHSNSAGPRWLPGSRTILVTQYNESENTNLLLAVDLPDTPEGELKTRTLRTLSNKTSITGLVVSPNALQLGIIGLYDSGEGVMRAVLRRLAVQAAGDDTPLILGLDDPSGPAGSSPGVSEPEKTTLAYLRRSNTSLAWLADGGMGILLRGGPSNPEKTVVQYVDPEGYALVDAAVLEDTLYSAAWSPDGRYVLLSTESGVWLVDVMNGRQGKTAPLWISPEPLFEMDWK
jgi:Tol biopolymer transport system component